MFSWFLDLPGSWLLALPFGQTRPADKTHRGFFRSTTWLAEQAEPIFVRDLIRCCLARMRLPAALLLLYLIAWIGLWSQQQSQQKQASCRLLERQANSPKYFLPTIEAIPENLLVWKTCWNRDRWNPRWGATNLTKPSEEAFPPWKHSFKYPIFILGGHLIHKRHLQKSCGTDRGTLRLQVQLVHGL